jgi:hypothetical protein
LEWKKIVQGHKYNEEDFIKIFGIPRNSFRSFVQLLKHIAAFCWNDLKQRKHYSSGFHLLVLLKYMSLEGLGIGKGSVRNYLLRAVGAVLLLFKDTVFWPDGDEQKEIRN